MGDVPQFLGAPWGRRCKQVGWSSGGPGMGEVPQLLGILWGGRFIIIGALGWEINASAPQGHPLGWEICLGSSEFTKVGWGHTRKFTHSHFSGDTHESYPIPTSSIIPPHTTIHPPHPIFTILQRWGRKREWEFIYLSSVEYPGVRNSRRPGVGIGSVDSPGVGNHRRPGVGNECLGSSRPSPGVGDLPWLIRISK